eukprot:Unigene2316_Nuclearia_a/m.7164 Unigene2316_Nuclearia_a/g.7164  ORF Unigene2316_Nuclearia_a/g.7164 Unigene2316_Nuclearia_a/m.7164 type:complete len:353 (-) Unigene2316_Nuclearia_a:179-1237(-)
MEMLTFNIDDGYLEGIVRGFRIGVLRQSDYLNLTQCENLDDLKLHLASTDYGNFLQNEPSPLATATIAEKCTLKLVDEFNYMRAHAVEPLAKFLDYITFSYMIDNVVLLITGTLHERDTKELMQKCHPLGMFETMETLCTATNMQELYNSVLIDTPLAPYFAASISAADLDEINIETMETIEIIRNTLYKAYLEDFYRFCRSLGGSTAETMSELLQFEADRRAINITINSLNTELTKDDRAKMCPSFGKLYPEGIMRLRNANDYESVVATCAMYADYAKLFDETGGGDRSLEDRFFQREVNLCKMAFMGQFNYAVFFCYIRLKEQEIRNIVWIAECISQNQRDKMNNYISIF